jgi:2-dehydro-3-deoxyglucarate aldolase/4-hydroxy-2-oxoheptanedioate aldolase
MYKELKQKVRNCEQLCGTHMALNYCAITEILAGVGFDFVWIDSEHAPLTWEDIRLHLVSCKAGGSPAFVRVPMHDFNFTKKVLEMGPAGIIFPQIETVEEADFAMKSTLYPPLGRRGYGPQMAVGYGKRELKDYLENINDELCRFVQVESETAVKNLPEIVKNPWIDGFIIGPMDLSGSIGCLGDCFCDRNIALIKEAIKILRDNNKTVGISTGSDDPEVLQFWHDLGINMISTGVDYAYMRNAAVRNLANIRKIQA